MSDFDDIKLPSDLSLTDPEPKPERKQRKERSDKGKPRGPRGSKKSSVTDLALKTALEELLVMPAIPSAMLYPTVEGKMYLLEHFTVTAPWGAERLVEASKQSAALRAQLEKLQQKTATGLLLGFVLVYLGGPALFVVGRHEMAMGLTQSVSGDASAMAAAAQQMTANFMTPEDMEGTPPSESNGNGMPSHNPAPDPQSDVPPYNPFTDN